MKSNNAYKRLSLFFVMKRRPNNREASRKEIIHSVVMVSEPQYIVLEKIVEYWNKELKGIDLPTLINELYSVPILFPDEKELGKYAKYLCSRGFVSQKEGNTFIPTHRGAEAYRKIHKGARMAANCRLPDY